MNVSYELRKGYLYIQVTGDYVQTTAQNIFFEWIEKAYNHTSDNILCDITLLTGFEVRHTSLAARFNMSKFIIESMPGKFKLAVLETPEQLEGAEFVENVAVNRGVKVKATSDLDEALEWLGVI